MGKRHFVIRHQDERYKCYLDDDGRVYVLDGNENPKVISSSAAIDKIEDAKEVARALIDSFSKSE